MNKGRAIRPVRRMGTEVHADRRTRRLRTRSDEERYEIEDSWEAYAEAWDQLHGEDDPDGLDDIIADLRRRENRPTNPRLRITS